ncbi:MAG: type II toxin-antitoxin system VapC family toxin [Candidatus Thorarchaeota archaeon]
MKVVLDSSAIIKRYHVEPGTKEIDILFRWAHEGTHVLVWPLWNVGEVLGTLDKLRHKEGWSGEVFETTMSKFVAETTTLLEKNNLLLLPIDNRFLFESWPFIIKYRIYQADALQLVTAQGEDRILVTADKKLLKAAKTCQIQTMNPEETAIQDILS